MRVLQLDIENFRGIAKGTVTLPPHALLIGPNNVGKSTVLEALDLVLGPERMSGSSTVDEHDFHNGKYLPVDGAAAPEIVLNTTLGALTDIELTKFRAHVEVWNAAEARVYTVDEVRMLTPALGDYVLRIQFRGRYDAEGDEFHAETVFVSPERQDGTRDAIGRRQKQAIGFLYLRSLRTARRAATLQRGSLLDVLLNVSDAEPVFWEGLLKALVDVGEATSTEPGLRAILDDVEGAIGAYLPPRKAAAKKSRLNVTQLTRDQLRSVMTYFISDHETGHLLPFDRAGSGVANLLVLALLTLIARRKTNVIFAMEEPEIALGPTVQRLIVSKLRTISTQALLTSHSPYVAEQLLPDGIVVLRREDSALRTKGATATAELKEKILRQDFRKKFAEGLLGNAVIIVEGDTEVFALPAASDVLAGAVDTNYRSLDAQGVIPVSAGGDGELAKVASFFSNAGIKTLVFCDTLKDQTILPSIQAQAANVEQHPHKSFEALLSNELSFDVIRRTLKVLAARADFPAEVAVPAEAAGEPAWRDALRRVLEKRKGNAFGALVLNDCQPAELPVSIRKYLKAVHEFVTGALLPATDPLHAVLS